MISKLSDLPNLLHVDVGESPHVLESFNIQISSLNCLKAFVQSQGNFDNDRYAARVGKSFTAAELPLYALNGSELVSVVAPADGWTEPERHLDILKRFFAEEESKGGGERQTVRVVLKSGKETEFAAAKEIEVWLGERKVACISNFTDFVARKEKMKLSKSNQMSKSINNYGYVWTTTTVYYV